MNHRDDLNPETRRAMDALSAMDGLSIREAPGGTPVPFAVPRWLSRITCDDCGTSAPAPDAADALTLDHLAGCHVGVLDARQRNGDTVFLLALRAADLPTVRVRPTVEHEAALLSSSGIDVRQVRVELTPAGTPRRTWLAERQ